MNHFFVVDVGNTSTKWGVAGARRIFREYEFPTGRFIGARDAMAMIRRLPRGLAGGIVSCVVPRALERVKRCFRALRTPQPLLVSAEMDLGIGIRYPAPQTIGADRLANSVAAVALYGAPAVVVDFGTAVTFDVISARGEYLGGVIAPGLEMMTDYLHERTALLPKVSLAAPRSAIGKSTEAAMRAGAVVGYRGLVREILGAVAREMLGGARRGRRPCVIATGGHSSLIAAGLPQIHHLNPRLTLEGLRILYCRHQAKILGRGTTSV